MKLPYLLPFFIFFTIIYKKSGAQSAGKDLGMTTEIRIIPESAEMDVPVSELLDSVCYIPLETTRESTFGNIKQLAVTKEYFIILDQSLTMSVLLFHRNGRFYKKIDKFNGKPFGSLYSLYVDETGGRIVVYARVDGLNGDRFVYTMKGEQVKMLPAENFNDFHTFGHQKTAFAYSLPQKYALVVKDSVGNPLQRFFPTSKDSLEDDEVISPDKYFFHNSDSAVFFIKPYDYSVYRLDQNLQLTIPYRFVFPFNRSISPDFLTNQAYKGKRVEMRSGKIYAVDCFFAKGNTLVFELQQCDFELLVYNVQTGMLSSVNHLQPDKASCYLPVTGRFSSSFSGKELYTSLSALDLFTAARKVKDPIAWKKSLTPSLRNFFEKGDKYTNPVISILYFKP